ncbi:1b9a7caa-2a31-4eb5-9b91-70515189f2ea [Thermothielavioides terrestris]|uniref:1b9a7caa-2a31-4eb5-9b91-70515189f2ea n=1 Tax=Thermothielavioides terrestris TaxID=2587410 RepID=A0A446BA81_9PEZI|nr:1b9a7caa-2a31-4eb5-9b91-70515189f2ea [Thermothielavioides terrestris]
MLVSSAKEVYSNR